MRCKRPSRVGRHALRHAPLIVPALAVLAPLATAQTATSWLAPADGQWTDGTKWSSSPVYPRNGAPTPADAYAVTVGVAGSPYTITLDASTAPGATIAMDR